MDRMIAVVFDSEGKAYEGSKALKELDAEGSITLYAVGVIAKDATGKVTVKEAADQGPLGTAVGLVTGSLIGLIGGPVGVAIGAYAGTLGGIMYDLGTVGIGDDFLAEVGGRLKPGKTAVVAEVEEEWVMPVDTRMEAAGGVVFRRGLGEVQDALIERDANALKAEIAHLKAEHAQATGQAKAKLQAKIDAAKAKLQATHDRAKAALEASRKKMDAKIKSLQEQAAKAKGDAKAKLETRIVEVRSEYNRRMDKLKQAWELTKQALGA
ncbi:MAG TPA: DUF1269 domain-containing protein [Methylococcaceae bacterium]|nr:DUF1269 domain-containing protein [Methylococcaceae bacterium]